MTNFFLKRTLSMGCCIHTISGVGFPSTSQFNVTMLPMSDSMERGFSLNDGPSVRDCIEMSKFSIQPPGNTYNLCPESHCLHFFQ